MKIPPAGPTFQDVLADASPERIQRLFSSDIGKMPENKYLHWSKLKYLAPPEGFSSEEWWVAIKLARVSVRHTLPLHDKTARPFSFSDSGYLYRMLHEVDRDASERIELPADVVTTDARNRYLVNSLVEEAITSSQLEGAATTRRVAKEMLRSGRAPRDRGEQMIVNNYRAMEFVRDLAREDLTVPMLLELQRIVTEDTLDDRNVIGRFRLPSDPVYVVDQRDGTVLHEPPDARDIEERVERLLLFANAADDVAFVHPVVRAILLHFMIGYDHPFVDGNGRTARALFYWAMARFGYWMTEFLSISATIRKAPVQYARAYVLSENDDNDVTYFLDYNLRVILRSIRQLHAYLARKAREMHDVQRLLDRFVPASVLNYRQVALIVAMRKSPDMFFTIASHRRSHNVSYQTARTDLSNLSDLRLVTSTKRGRAFVYRLARDFDEQLRHLAHERDVRRVRPAAEGLRKTTGR